MDTIAERRPAPPGHDADVLRISLFNNRDRKTRSPRIGQIPVNDRCFLRSLLVCCARTREPGILSGIAKGTSGTERTGATVGSTEDSSVYLTKLFAGQALVRLPFALAKVLSHK